MTSARSRNEISTPVPRLTGSGPDHRSAASSRPSTQSSTNRWSRVGEPSPQSSTSPSDSSIFRIIAGIACDGLEVEVVPGPVEVRRQQERSVEPVLVAVRLRSDEDRLLRDAVRRIRLLGIAAPELVLGERDGRELRIRANGSDDDELAYLVDPRELEHMSAHDQVRVPEAAGTRPIRADSAHLAGEVEDELRLRVGEQALRVGLPGQVVVAPPRDEGLRSSVAQPFDEVRAEEPAASGDAHVHVASTALGVSQSTRPIQRSRVAAYQAIVFATPSSHDTSGSHPVSR